VPSTSPLSKLVLSNTKFARNALVKKIIQKLNITYGYKSFTLDLVANGSQVVENKQSLFI